jgi:type IV pilus assembly protein PilN
MARINLLPWRAERRKQRQKEFNTLMAGGFLGGVVLVFLGWMYFNGQIGGQTNRNAYLEQQIADVQQQIKEIEGLEAKKASLLKRKEVIESLQADRSQNVKLFEELARTIPDGVRLMTVKQTGSDLAITGRSQSNARVSSYMRNLEVGGLISNPRLTVIEAKGEDRALPFEFSMNVTMGKPETEASEDAAETTPSTGGTP